MKKYPPIVKVITYNNIDDFFDQVLNFRSKSKIDLKDYIFRGHSHEHYRLIPSALRKENRDILYKWADRNFRKERESSMVHGDAEMEILRKFYDKADIQSLNIPEIPFFKKNNSFKSEDVRFTIPQNMHSLAALAQHYGCLTRLLDWTESIITALYFAIVGNANEKQFKTLDFMDIWCLSKLNASHLSNGMGKDKELFIFRPQYRENPNLAAQKGIFSIWNSHEFDANVDRRPLEENFFVEIKSLKLETHFKKLEPFFYLFKIPKTFIKELYSYLSENNCTASKLFPGYYGVVREIMEDSLFK